MKIIFFDTRRMPEYILHKKVKYENVIFVKKTLTLDNVQQYQNAEIICINVSSVITKNILDKLPNLKLITLMTTGFDNVDLEECKNRKIIVTNVPSYSNESVAEHAMALLFTISKRIHICNEEIEKCNIDMPKLMGFELKNKTIGLIGTGSIGLHMAKLCKGVGMKVIAFDIHKNEDVAETVELANVDSPAVDTATVKTSVVAPKTEEKKVAEKSENEATILTQENNNSVTKKNKNHYNI